MRVFLRIEFIFRFFQHALGTSDDYSRLWPFTTGNVKAAEEKGNLVILGKLEDEKMIIDRLKFSNQAGENKMTFKRIIFRLLLFVVAVVTISHIINIFIIYNLGYDQLYDLKTKKILTLGDSKDSLEKYLAEGEEYLKDNNSVWYRYDDLRVEYRNNKCISFLTSLISDGKDNKRYKNNKNLSFCNSKKKVYKKYGMYNPKEDTFYNDKDYLAVTVLNGHIEKYSFSDKKVPNNAVFLHFTFEPPERQKLYDIYMSLEDFTGK